MRQQFKHPAGFCAPIRSNKFSIMSVKRDIHPRISCISFWNISRWDIHNLQVNKYSYQMWAEHPCMLTKHTFFCFSASQSLLFLSFVIISVILFISHQEVNFFYVPVCSTLMHSQLNIESSGISSFTTAFTQYSCCNHGKSVGGLV
jgi:hypothetical protein